LLHFAYHILQRTDKVAHSPLGVYVILLYDSGFISYTGGGLWIYSRHFYFYL